MKEIFNVAISCIGSGVGQSVINSCRLSRLPIKTFGFGTNPFAYGLYDCDEFVYSPSIYSVNYVEQFIELCKKNKIDVVIPGMDDEAHIFAKNIQKFRAANLKVIVAGIDLLELCRDKEEMSNVLNKISPIFVKSYSKEKFINSFEDNEIEFPVIAKPRNGFASRGIEIINSKDDLVRITESHIVQELAIPAQDNPERQFYLSQLKKNVNVQIAEISIQLVANQEGEIMGRMVSYNKLNNGVPIEIVPYENAYIWAEIEKFYPVFEKLGLFGPLNIQGRLTDNGLKLFELNARFTGITGLRAYMGFNEVEACIKEWLNIDSGRNSLLLNYNKFGLRQTADKCIDIERNKEVHEFSKTINGVQNLKLKHNILITGATGYLGRNLIDKILRDNLPFNIWAYVRNKKLAERLLPEQVVFYDKIDLDNGLLSLGNVDIILHAGFARPHCEEFEIADSLKFSGELFQRAVASQVANIINISSQSIYGQGSLPPWTESSPIAPQSSYGSAKYATEVLLENLARQYPQINFTSLRLGTLTGGTKGMIKGVDLLSKLVNNAVNSVDIVINGGTQIIERVDIRDVVNGICRIILKTNQKWRTTYNLGSGKPINIVDLAERIVEIVSKRKKISKSKILVNKYETNQAFGLDNTSFKIDFDWLPRHGIDDSINSLLDDM